MRQQKQRIKKKSNLMSNNNGWHFKIDNKDNNTKSINDKHDEVQMRLYQTTQKLLRISQIFLCAPTAVHKPKKPHDSPRDKFLYCFHLVWCISLYFGLAACVYDEYTTSNMDLPTVQKPLYFSEYLIYLVHILEIIVRIYKGREKFWSFYDSIVDFDCKLVDFKLPVNYKNLGFFIRLHLALIVLHFTLTLIVGYFYSDGVWLSFFRTSTVYVIPNMIIQLSLIHYYAMLFGIGERLDKLFVLLDQLLLDSANYDVPTLRSRLHTVRYLYTKLEQLTHDVNTGFSYSIVLIYVGSFINISINIFLLYKYFNEWNTADLAWTAYSAVWTCMHIAKMTLILYYNENIQNKKTKTLHLLSTFRYDDMALEPPIRHFMLQLMSDTRSNVICGMAALNLNFITSLLVAISTLFIFLVQYDITFEALTKTHNPPKPHSILLE
ncbi:putative gustatory receptor 59f [Haematobia irritans]|uniref:putative gustatory receptor 59f n=1 Tax=Haematobia irritans TaxID=7368 RepID=UPI003F4FC993